MVRQSFLVLLPAGIGRSRPRSPSHHMRSTLQFPQRAETPPADHIVRNCVIELPYLHDGRRVFVAVDERGWMLARGMGSGDAECQHIIDTLNNALDQHHAQPKPRLLSDA